MSTVSIPDELIAKLRALDRDDDATLGELVVRALANYVDLAEAKALVARAREREEVAARAGISERDIAEHFHQWRRRNSSYR